MVDILQSQPNESIKMEKNEPGAESVITVHIQFFGSIRAAADRENEEIDLPSGAVVYELLQLLSDRYGDAFQGEIFQPTEKELREDVTVTVNGMITEPTRIRSLKMTNGARIALLPSFPGGG